MTSSNNINYTWAEQVDILDIKYTSQHPLPQYMTLSPSHQPSQITETHPNIWQITNFFSPQECANWIIATKVIGYESHTAITPIGQTLLAESKSTNIPIIWNSPESIRTNKRLIWQVPQSYADNMFARITLPPTLSNPSAFPQWHATNINRRFRFFKTDPGEEFKHHVDAACAKDDNTRSFLSLIIWLNDNFTGGKLSFENNIEITPKTGDAVMFWQDGHPDVQSHRGMPVETGTKFLLRSDVMYEKVI